MPPNADCLVTAILVAVALGVRPGVQKRKSIMRGTLIEPSRFQCRGVLPSLSRALRSAPASRRTRI